jgi:3D (Asp-Asp-Asp) domain-containing protein
MRLLTFALLLLVACGKDPGSKSSLRGPERHPSKPPLDTEVEPDPRVNPEDVKKIADLLPTMYYIAEEAKVNCKGKYGNATYNGTEKSKVRTMDGQVIATVCTRFYKVLMMEGSAVLRNNISVNYSGIVDGEKRFHKLDRCIYGEGVERDLCLLPYHTLATDNKVHQIGDILFVPKAVGLLLPDGTKHEGYFIVRDTGKAFEGIGAQRVDMFTGLDPDYSNVFQKAGFHHKNPMEAFKVSGPSADVVKDNLRAKFGTLY